MSAVRLTCAFGRVTLQAEGTPAGTAGELPVVYAWDMTTKEAEDPRRRGADFTLRK